ncbi:MAG: hypothetical protein Q8P52_01595 [bacterium]|nr:hypothetical protein [bacterium]
MANIGFLKQFFGFVSIIIGSLVVLIVVGVYQIESEEKNVSGGYNDGYVDK